MYVVPPGPSADQETSSPNTAVKGFRSTNACSAAPPLALLQATVEKGFRKIGTSMAPDFPGFISNINDFIMHMHLSMGYPGYLAPDFRTENVSTEQASLDPGGSLWAGAL